MGTLLTLEEIATRSRIPLPTLRYWRSTGTGGPPTFRLGRRVVAYVEDVDAWIEAAKQRDPRAKEGGEAPKI